MARSVEAPVDTVISDPEKIVTAKLFVFGQALFGKQVVKDCVAWRDARGDLAMAWICDPLRMVTWMGVGSSEPTIKHERFDYLLRAAFGLAETHFKYERGAVNTYDWLEKLKYTVRDFVLSEMGDYEDFLFTLIPEPGWPWPCGGDSYWSAKTQRAVKSLRPEWLMRVPANAEYGKGESWGVDFCKFLGRAPVTGERLGNAIVAEFPGEDIIVTHVVSPRATTPHDHPHESIGAWRAAGESVHRCGGFLFASLAVGPVPATNFGLCVLVARAGLALAGVKPYRGRGAAESWLYTSDVWTGRIGEFATGYARSAFEQLHGSSDYMSNIDTHIWTLGAPTGELLSGGPADVVEQIQSTKRLSSELKRRFKIWKRELTPENVRKVQEQVAMTTARYAYLEAKINGVTPMSAFPVAVCPAQQVKEFRVFLDAAGWDGELIELDVPVEIYRAITDYEWLSKQTTDVDMKGAIQAWAELQYGWHVADVLRARGPRMHVSID